MFGSASSSGWSAACSCGEVDAGGRDRLREVEVRRVDRARVDRDEPSSTALSVRDRLAEHAERRDVGRARRAPGCRPSSGRTRRGRTRRRGAGRRSARRAPRSPAAGRRCRCSGTLMTPLPSCGGSCGAGSPGTPGTSGIADVGQAAGRADRLLPTRSAGPVSPVRAKKPLALTGSGVAGRPPPLVERRAGGGALVGRDGLDRRARGDRAAQGARLALPRRGGGAGGQSGDGGHREPEHARSAGSQCGSGQRSSSKDNLWETWS